MGSRAPRFLIIDGYNRAGREELEAGGASTAGTLYRAMLETCAPGCSTQLICPADPGVSLPDGEGLGSYDGIAWTGSSLTIYHETDEVRAQVELARVAFASGVPQFGTCWGAQMAAFAAGGRVAVNPRGREMGIARKIHLTPEGRGHPFYEGKPTVFDAFISHEDEVTHIPAGGVHLATNFHTRVQAVAVTHGAGTFWGLQYHPEYDLHELARLTFCRTDKLIKKGFFRDREAVIAYVDELEALHTDPGRTDIAWKLGIDADVMDPDVRLVEVRNWVRHQVLPGL